jgi:serine/threonine-protein kinase
MHQSSIQNREAAYRIILIALRFIPNMLESVDAKKLLDKFQKHLEKLYFFEKSENIIQYLTIKLSFILNKTNALLEILHTQDLDDINIENAIFSLLELNEIQKAEIELEKNKEKIKSGSYNLLKLIFNQPTQKALNELFTRIDKKASFKKIRILIFILEKLLDEKKSKKILDFYELIKKIDFDKETKILLDGIFVRAYFMENNIKQVSKILNKYPLENINEENSPLHFLYGLWLYKTEKKEIAETYFSGLLDTAYPFSFAISSHFIANKNKSFLKKAFHYEKRRLLKDLLLYHFIIKNKQILKQTQKITIN